MPVTHAQAAAASDLILGNETATRPPADRLQEAGVVLAEWFREQNGRDAVPADVIQRAKVAVRIWGGMNGGHGMGCECAACVPFTLGLFVLGLAAPDRPAAPHQDSRYERDTTPGESR